MKNALLAVSVALAVSPGVPGGGCVFDRLSPTPAPGSYRLSVPYHRQLYPRESTVPQKAYCVPATVLMWKDYLEPPWFDDVPWQDDIFSYADSRGWTAWQNGAIGVLEHYTASLASYWTGISISRSEYLVGEERLALADLDKALHLGSPTMVLVNEGTHVVLFLGTSWQQLPATLQPSKDYVLGTRPD